MHSSMFRPSVAMAGLALAAACVSITTTQSNLEPTVKQSFKKRARQRHIKIKKKKLFRC